MLLDFATIPARRPPKACLACPESWARPDADVLAPVFAAPLDGLRQAVVAVAAEEARTHLVRLDKQARQAEFEQRSRILGFPDTITVAFEAAGHGGATLAIYSRARYGYYDFGVNRRRVQRWLAALEARLAPAREAA